MKALATTFSAVALAIVLSGAGSTGAQPGPAGRPGFGMHRPPMEQLLGPGGMGRWWNNPKAIERLKLTDDQRKEMDQILLEHREKLIDMRGAVEKAELAMEPLVGADQPNEQAILAQIDKIAQARAELEKANARFLLAIRAKLTPEQFKELKSWREDRGGRQGRGDRPGREQHMQRWRNGGPGSQPGPIGAQPPAPQGAPGAAPPPSGPSDPESMLPPAPSPDPASDPGTLE
ncbi:MAG: periplasmic heavy metal sensor [Terracidiphilus sp.]